MTHHPRAGDDPVASNRPEENEIHVRYRQRSRRSRRWVDFTSADFLRIEDGVAAEHWDTVDYIRLHQSFRLLPEDLKDV
jgi:predicted SnoaL-like aldol condensation-catalyzing enzyme